MPINYVFRSYTDFIYSNIVVPKEIKPCDQAVVTAELKNIGTRDGDEVNTVCYRIQIEVEVKPMFHLLCALIA